MLSLLARTELTHLHTTGVFNSFGEEVKFTTAIPPKEIVEIARRIGIRRKHSRSQLRHMVEGEGHLFRDQIDLVRNLNMDYSRFDGEPSPFVSEGIQFFYDDGSIHQWTPYLNVQLVSFKLLEELGENAKPEVPAELSIRALCRYRMGSVDKLMQMRFRITVPSNGPVTHTNAYIEWLD